MMMLLGTSGCEDDERVVQIATEAADRQAEQNREMAQLHREVAEGTNRLVTENGAVRQETVQLQQGLHAERQTLDSQRQELESERQAIAGSRRTESFLVHLSQGLATVFIAALAITAAWFLLHRARSEEAVQQTLCELLLEDFVPENAAAGESGQEFLQGTFLTKASSLRPQLPLHPSSSEEPE